VALHVIVLRLHGLVGSILLDSAQTMTLYIVLVWLGQTLLDLKRLRMGGVMWCGHVLLLGVAASL
jgi:hypothetical protein